MMITIITVGYNEEVNLPKLYDSLQKVEDILPLRKIYVDQSSTDSSTRIAQDYGCEVFIHPNKGYADPDKKWAVEELCNDDDWILILDADEEVSQMLAYEILKVINSGSELGNIGINIYILGGGIGGKTFQMRLFKKNAIFISKDIHDYIRPQSNKIYNMKNFIINNDLKFKGREIETLLNKMNRYSTIDAESIDSISKYKLYVYIYIKPIIWFFGFGLWRGYFSKGIPGVVSAFHNMAYEFFKWTKVYERLYITKSNQGKNT